MCRGPLGDDSSVWTECCRRVLVYVCRKSFRFGTIFFVLEFYASTLIYGQFFSLILDDVGGFIKSALSGDLNGNIGNPYLGRLFNGDLTGNVLVNTSNLGRSFPSQKFVRRPLSRMALQW